MISVSDLVYRYDGTTAVDGVSLQIEDGEFVVIAGANGSGKTTLVRHFNGLYEPDSGEVRVDGQPVAENPVAARTAVGMVFQNPRDCFVAATVGADVAFGPENLGLSHEDIDARIERALAAVGMADAREVRIDTLSGGQQARVAIAGALAMEPSHLVLDEPFAGLDWPARTGVLDRLEALSADGTSVIVVTHDLRDLMDRTDRIVALADGEIVLDGPPSAVAEELPNVDVRPC
ncbi:ABC-type transport system ATP-binding protein (probable substrate biotin) [Natronomonas pharaonis DSM 2160]|uniref:ABC-type transport system ATP-binding protein (Probable substrate biotin) n=1 Tax=Natronomonas pharaonis (strain ATCC 35678 / DSM 2160 / CIP 103997 / JCM 8858 / NBRC 14720 / NCIMB 2260 / Gabara) TaxID=348780 RepID=A0A1U7EUX0_NATPD|nr:ABC transporter ATP-binding protein [Natronomonas pharaonis]CAI48789.1 ABC-type transport system ATP-binding protein (probable substrate biotin) [Natronomonas pharaonis DSM 2160]